MKILFVGDLELDGIVAAPSKVGYELFKRTLKKYKNVQFFTYFQDGSKYSRFQKLFGKQIVKQGIIQMGLFPFLFNIIKFRPDVVQVTSLSVYYIIGFPFLKLLDTKIFYLIHNLNKYTLNKFTIIDKKLKRRILLSEKLSILFASKIFVLSEQEKIHLLSNFNVASTKVEIVDNGIEVLDIKKDYSLKHRITKIITVGSLDRKEKGLDDLIYFLEEIDIPIELTICHYKKHLKKVSTDKPNLKLEWLEPLNKNVLRKEFTKNDFFISFSEYESFSIALLEAMNTGLLFLATDRIGLTERFDKNLQKYVVPFGDWKYAKNIFNFLLHLSFEEKQKLSNEIINFSNQFSWDKVVKKYFELYGE